MKQLALLLLVFALTSRQQLLAQTPPTGFTNTLLSSQWNEAVGLTFNKTGNQMFVWERPGRVWVVENNEKKLVLDISPEVAGYRDFGLLGFALHPQFETNGYIYLLYNVDRHHLMKFGTTNYSATTNEYYQATIGRITRYTVTKTTTGYSAGSRKILLGATKTTGIPILHESHGVGSLVFGSDGNLFVSAGDGASYSSNDVGSATESYYAQALTDGIITPEENVGSFRSQLLESYNGKILRINPETGAGVSGNPFYDSNFPSSVRSKVWALGLRNPYRMVLKPNSGTPGVLYIGDVGYGTWEELNIANKPGQNFGWPVFEGLTVHTGYASLKTYNKKAPNPLNGINGCTQPYFYFQDLIKQETFSNTATFSNPCNTAESIPTTIKTFQHSRPKLEWKHNTAVTRTGTFSGETATETSISTTGSPITGSQFGGVASTAGIFYPHNDFPAGYQNSYFFGDYGGRWIRNLKFNTSTGQPEAVRDFISSGAVVVAMAANPAEPGLYYINFPSEIRKVTYNATNSPPEAVASTAKNYGPSGTSFQFTGSASKDPEGLPLTYLWNFGDGTTSTAINPAHIFTTATNTPTKFTVTLTVKDHLGSTDQASLFIYLNNTPPQVTITSPLNNTLYPMTSETVYALKASVSDLEHTSTELYYSWVTTLHHNDHTHIEPAITTAEATTTITPLGCGAETYYYSITLTVKDAGGLATTKVANLYPDCNKKPTVTLTAPASGTSYAAPANITLSANAADTDGTIARVEFYRGTVKLGQDESAPYSYTWHNVLSGSYSLTAKAVDNEGATTTSSAVTVNVTTASAPTVTLTSPTATTSFTAPASIALAASASDADGVAKVEFFNGTTKLGEDLTSPYTLSWSNVSYGTYTLTAKATDATGVSTISAAVLVTVKTKVVSFTLIDARNGNVLIPNLVNGATINMATLGTKKVNIRVNTSTPRVGSVASYLTGADTKHSIDDTAPYYLIKGSNGFWMPRSGKYTLKATPYSGINTTGTPGTSLTINFSVVKSSTSTTALKTVKSETEDADIGPTEMTVSYFPNPYSSEFTLVVQGKQQKVLPVKIYDTTGRLVLTLEDVPESKPLYLGEKLRSGTYTLVVGTGQDAREFKILKLQ